MSHHITKPVPERHLELLEVEVAKVQKGDMEFVIQQYERHNPDLRNTGTRMIDTMMRQLDEIFCLLHTHPEITPRHQNVCIAALRYFLREHDHIDDSHAGGLTDDALVVQAAVNELQAPLEEI